MATFDELVVDKLSARKSNLGENMQAWRRPSPLLPAGDAWYVAGNQIGSSGVVAIGIGSLVANPLFGGRGFFASLMRFVVTVGGGAGSVGRVGLYNAIKPRCTRPR